MSASLPNPYASPAPEPATTPEVVGVRVHVGAMHAREYPLGRRWEADMDGQLIIEDGEGAEIALYAAAAWQSVEQITT